ncbi:MAG: EamA family transporter [Chitinispirillaceae bacterium]|nr:EamA family transporter [Chitinispirillaceae bacterium]
MQPATTEVSREKKRLSLTLLCYATVYLVWGGTYLFIRLAVQTIPPFHVVGIRFLSGGILILFFCLVSRRIKRLPTLREIAASVFLGTFLLIGGNGLVTLAEKKVDSHLAALIISSTPLGVALFDLLLFRKKLSFVRWLGILSGICGVAVLLFNGSSFGIYLSPEILLVICALASWSFATSLGHRIKVYPDVFVNSGIQMTFVGGICLLLVQSIHPLSPVHFTSFSRSSLIGLSYLIIAGSTAFAAYNYLIKNEPAIRVTSYAFVNPIIALFLGIVVAGETPKPFLLPGVILILPGLFAMLYGDALLRKNGR